MRPIAGVVRNVRHRVLVAWPGDRPLQVDNGHTFAGPIRVLGRLIVEDRFGDAIAPARAYPFHASNLDSMKGRPSRSSMMH